MSELLGLDEGLAALEAAEKAAPAVIETPMQVQRADGSLATRGREDKVAEAQPKPKPASASPAKADPAETGAETAEAKAEGLKLKAEADAAAKAAQTAKGTETSRYAKAQERLGRTWEDVNKRKGELDSREQTLLAREQQATQRQQELERTAGRSTAQYTPEQFDEAAAARSKRGQDMHAIADGLDAKVNAFQDDGKYPEAAALQIEAKAKRKEAYGLEAGADDLKEAARNLRANPAPTVAQRQQQDNARWQAQNKEATLQAATRFPELGVKGSPLQSKVVELFGELKATAPDLLANPRIIFLATRLAAAELGAGRVTGLETELGKAKARVSELEKMSAPGGGGRAVETRETAPTDEQEEAELKRAATEMGYFR